MANVTKAGEATKEVVETAKAETKSTVESIRENVTERASAATKTVSEGYKTATDTAGAVAGVAKDFGAAYYNGVTTVSKTLFGFAQDVYAETAEHATKVMKAKDMTSVAELQAAFIQNRIENAAKRGKIFVDVAHEQTRATWKPVVDALATKKAA
ncbi:MAG: phasin family protein [Pseudomonadota bacterium]